MSNITDELSIEANSVDLEQTVCHRGFLKISADEKSRRLLLRLAHYELKGNAGLSMIMYIIYTYTLKQISIKYESRWLRNNFVQIKLFIP